MSVALVTGASRGIGRSTAIRLAKDGFDVAVHYKAYREGAEATAAEARRRGRRALCIPADLEDPGAIETLFATIATEMGQPPRGSGSTRLAPVPWTPIRCKRTPREWARIMPVCAANGRPGRRWGGSRLRRILRTWWPFFARQIHAGSSGRPSWLTAD